MRQLQLDYSSKYHPKRKEFCGDHVSPKERLYSEPTNIICSVLDISDPNHRYVVSAMVAENAVELASRQRTAVAARIEALQVLADRWYQLAAGAQLDPRTSQRYLDQAIKLEAQIHAYHKLLTDLPQDEQKHIVNQRIRQAV